MKKVFQIKGNYYWACNGQRVRNVWYVEHMLGSRLAWMTRSDNTRTRIEIVDPPPGRCPNCGTKQ